jgi:hypothetical protein
MTRSRNRVLIGFAESLAAIESAWMLREAGFEVHAFTRRGTRPALAHSRTIRVHDVTPPGDDVAATVSEVTALAGALCADVVLPLDDDAVWVLDNAGAGLVGAQVAGPTGTLAQLALDKRLQIEAARACGLVVPETAVWARGDPVPDVPPTAGGWVVKPALAVEKVGAGLCRGDVRIVRTRSALEEVLARCESQVLVQPRLAGTGVGVFGFATATGSVTAMSGHRRVRMMNPTGSGSSACSSAAPSAQVAAAVTRLVADTGWRGLFMVELLAPVGGSEPVFMELNGRTWGSMALARRRGLRYPVWAVEAALGHDPDPAPAGPDHDPTPGDRVIVTRHLGRELVHLAFVMRGPRHGVDAEWPGRLRTARTVLSWRRGDVLYNHRRGELPTLLADTWQTVAQQGARGLRRVTT